MPTKEDHLRRYTFKDDADDLGQRVFYTLTQSRPEAHSPTAESVEFSRIAKAVSLLLVHLKNRGLLSDDEIDDFLLDVAL